MEQKEKVIPVYDNFIRVREEAAEAALRSGRKPGEVRLVAVTKFVDTERIAQAIAAGAVEVGENRAQELTEKYEFLKNNAQTIHFIGQLQLNKVKYLIGRADLIQSADRLEAFAEINRLAQKHGIRQGALVEVNIGSEPQKAGVAPAELPELLKRVSEMEGVSCRGLMCIPPADDEKGSAYYFAKMKELFESVRAMDIAGVSMEILSMGMSHDYKEAIAAGSNMVRVGSAIFGARPKRPL